MVVDTREQDSFALPGSEPFQNFLTQQIDSPYIRSLLENLIHIDTEQINIRVAWIFRAFVWDTTEIQERAKTLIDDPLNLDELNQRYCLLIIQLF